MKFIALFLLFACLSSAESFDRSAWEKWKKENYKKDETSPTSFLNATSLAHARRGERLYLSAGSTRKATWWSRKPVKGFVAVVKNQNGKGHLTRAGKRDEKVSSDKKRFHWSLKNGAIAEVVYGTSSDKVWGYIYDPDQIKQFAGFRFYPFNPSAVVPGQFTSHKRKVVSYKTVQGDQRIVSLVGHVDFELHGQAFKLKAYNWQPEGEALKYIALIYADATAGKETYGGGREMVVMLPGGVKNGMELTLDFNRTTNFYCAHSPFWHCPTGLQEKINISVKAGEKLPLRKIASE